MSLWTLKEKFDQSVWFSLFNLREYTRYFLNKSHVLNTNIISRQWMIIANGPSSFNVPLSKDNVIFINFGFRREEFKRADCPFLLIVDPYLLDGTWPSDMLDLALEQNKSCIFLLNYKFRKDIEKRYKSILDRVIYIANARIPTSTNIKTSNVNSKFGFGVGAAEQAISVCAQLGARKIDVYGLDCDNVSLALSGKHTHVYGVDENKSWTDPLKIARELRFQSYMIERLYHLKKFLESNEIELVGHSDSVSAKFLRK
ncbi:hypothetical protein OAP36_02080 [Planktomarina temperata]|nr:hypothetical protein [Planktomarina temperata]